MRRFKIHSSNGRLQAVITDLSCRTRGNITSYEESGIIVFTKNQPNIPELIEDMESTHGVEITPAPLGRQRNLIGKRVRKFTL